MANRHARTLLVALSPFERDELVYLVDQELELGTNMTRPVRKQWRDLRATLEAAEADVEAVFTYGGGIVVTGDD